MKRPNPEKLAAQAAQWNLSHPIGTPVMRYELIAPLREGTETKTRSEAWVMGGHTVMVMVEGVSGGVLLESVKPLSLERLAHAPMTAPALTESQQRAVDTKCGPYCTPDDHLRDAHRGKCMLCGREFNPLNVQAMASADTQTPTQDGTH